MLHTASLVQSPWLRKSQVLARERATTVVLLNKHSLKLLSKYLRFLPPALARVAFFYKWAAVNAKA